MPANGRKKLSEQEILARAEPTSNTSRHDVQELIAFTRQRIQESRQHLHEFWRQMDEFVTRQTEFDERCCSIHAEIEKCASRAEAALKRFSNAAEKA